MKKIIPCIMLLMIFSVGVSSAQDDQSNKFNTLANNIDDKTENILERQISIPSSFSWIKVVLGIKQSTPLTIGGISIFIATWIMFFIIVKWLLYLIPFFKDWKATVGGIIITLLLAATGSINILAIFFFDINKTFVWIESLGSFSFLVSLLVVFLIIAGTRHIAKRISSSNLLEKAEKKGIDISTLIKLKKAMYSSPMWRR
jgi:hypothetical protein